MQGMPLMCPQTQTRGAQWMNVTSSTRAQLLCHLQCSLQSTQDVCSYPGYLTDVTATMLGGEAFKYVMPVCTHGSCGFKYTPIDVVI